MYEFTWFFIGAVCFKMLSALMGVGASINYLRTIQLHAVLLLSAAAEDISFIKRVKHTTLEESDFSKAQIELFKEADQEMFNNWKQSAISKMNASLPHKLRASLALESWDETLNILDSAYGKNKTRR
tara:strand:- start:666 stop:1046 length:381 start_codon:yes stop_codon:yes gene_type:complete